MKHVRKTPPEADAEWLRRHDQLNGPLQGNETEAEWKDRTTPPIVAGLPVALDVDGWLAYTGYGGLPVEQRRPSEPWIDWRARMFQQGPAETPPEKGRRTTAWRQANPQGAPGAAAGPVLPVENVPTFSTNAVSVTARVADTAQCKRIRIAYHLFRIPGVEHPAMVKNIRRRTFKWVRRVYAQALLSPKLVSIEPPLTLRDSFAAPVPNMLSIYNYVGSLARADSPALPLCSGRTATGQPSKVTLVLEDIEAAGRVERTIEAVLCPGPPPATGVTPLQMGAAVVAAVNHPVTGFGFHADLEVVPKSDRPHEQGCDIFITKGGRARRILRVSDDDAGLNRPAPDDPSVNGKSAVEKRLLQVPGLELSPPPVQLRTPAGGPEFKLGDNDDLIGGEPSQRRVLRMGRPGEDADATQALVAAPEDSRIDIYVVPSMGLAGRAYPDYAATADAVSRGVDISDPLFQAPTPLKNAAILAFQCGAFKVMDGGDASPFTLPHEIGHVLSRGGHNEAQGDLMAGRWPKKPEDSGLNNAVPDTNGVRAAKRIYGTPLMVGTEALRNNQDGTTDLRHFPRDMSRDMRERAPHLLENW